MFGLSRGELGIVLFIFGLVWGAGQLPRLGEWIAVHLATRRASPRDPKGS